LAFGFWLLANSREEAASHKVHASSFERNANAYDVKIIDYH
jgi:hypothetical protein